MTYPEVRRAELNEQHLVAFHGFSCGPEGWAQDLNAFLHENALREAKDGLNKTFVFYSTGREPVAFATLSASMVEKKNLLSFPPFANPDYPAIPALLLGRFGVDQRFQGQGYGTVIMRWIKEAARTAPFGCRFVALHVENENAKAISFYQREGFLMTPVRIGRKKDKSLMLYDLIASGREERSEEESPR